MPNNDEKEKLRLIANTERLAWEEEKMEQSDEGDYQNTISELSKRAVDILARADNPEYILSTAKEKSEKELDDDITVPPWKSSTPPEKKLFWTIIYRKNWDPDHDWWIEKNTWFGQYRLIGQSTRRIFFSIKDEAKVRTVLSNIIRFGKQQGTSTRFIQVVNDEKSAIKEECEKLLLERARKIFPETDNLAAGVFIIHPYNQYALIPVQDFYSTMALDKANESIVLLGKMGAKSVRISRSESEATSGSASATIHTIAVGGSVANELKTEMDFTVEFSGNSDISPSADLLQNSIWHKNDPQLSAIVESLSGKNKIKEWTFSEKELSHIDFDFMTAARILGRDAAELKAEFEKEQAKTRVFHVCF